MRQIIAVDSWKRKEEYMFFRTFFNPFVSVTVEVDCTVAYRKAKAEGFPFSLYYLHAAIVAANRVEEFRYRQEGEEVVFYDRVNLLTPIHNGDGSYRSVLLPAEEDWNLFRQKANPVVEAAKRGEGYAHSESRLGRDYIVISVNPWYRFFSVQLATPQNPHENIPIFTIGKMTELNNRRIMPVALSVNHSFVSGYQIGRFLEEFQYLLNR